MVSVGTHRQTPGGLIPTLNSETRRDLTNAQWDLLTPWLPGTSRYDRPRRYDLQNLINVICHRIRIGCPWRDLPDRYGRWWRIYALFHTWQLDDTWTKIEAQLRSQVHEQEKLGWGELGSATISVEEGHFRAGVINSGYAQVNRDARVMRRLPDPEEEIPNEWQQTDRPPFG